MPTSPTWEETTEIEPLWEETTPVEEPVALEPPDIVVQPQTGVVQSAAPGSIAPTDLKPSVRLIGGEQVTGQIGDTHPDIIKRENIPAVDIDQRGFQGPGGEFFPRESAAIATGLQTEMEPTRLHSTDLIGAGKTQRLLPPDWKPVPTAESMLIDPVTKLKRESGMEPGTELTTALWEQGTKLAAPVLRPIEKGLSYAGNVVRAIPADIAESIAGNQQYYDMLNLGAAALGETMPIDEALNEAASESKTWATVGKVSQGIAGTAPMIAAFGGLPAAAQKIALAGFTAQMLKEVPEIATQLGDELGKPKSEQDPAKITDLVSQGIQSAGFGTLGAYALARGPMAIRAQEIGKAEQLRAAQMESTGRGIALAPESAQALPGMAPSVWSPEMSPVIGGAAGATAMRLPPEAVRPVETAQVAPAPSTSPLPVEGIRMEPAPSEMVIPRETSQVSPAPSTAFPVRGEGRPFVADITPKVSDLVSRKPGETTFEEMMSVKDKDIPVLFDEFRKNNKSAQFDSPLAGEKMAESDLPKVTAARDKAATEMLEAMKTGKMDASFAPQARMIWLNGLIEGINKKGPNYESAKRLQSEGVWEKSQSITPEFSDALQGRQIQMRSGPALSESGIWSHLRDRHRIEKGGAITLVNRPDAPWSGQVIRNKKGDPVGIEINRAKITDANDINWVMEHEAAHWFDLTTPGGAAKILERSLDPMEWAQVDADIIAAKYNPSKFGPERTAFAIQALAKRWRKRSWFGKLTGKIMRFASDKIGIKMTRAAAENAAVRAVTRGIESAKSFQARQVERASALEGRTPEEIGKAAEQLTERLKATPAVGTRESLSLREATADTWSQGKAIFDRSRARAEAMSETIKDAAKGAREPGELDKRVGELDFLLQRAAGQSRDMGKTMRKQVRDANLRRAAAIWIDTPGDAATKTSTIRTALSDLQLNPELWRKTPNEVKRAMETAANMPAEGVQFAESLREYYARRNQDAVDHSLFEHGLEDYFTHVWGNEKNMPDDLRGAIGGGRVQTYWQFSRQRKLGTFLDGIMRGKIPQLDPANVLPFYNYTLDRAIASRSFIKNITDNMVASDGRAVVAPTGTLSKVPQGQPTEASLVRPKGKTGEIADYKTINHPALRKWKWMANDENGKPILSQNDLVVHPEHYERLARMMDMSRLKGSRVSEALLRASTEVKGFKLGLLSAFHQVHVGSHALFHWTLPFNFKDPRFFTPEGDIRWNSPDVRFAIEKGHLKIAPDARELKIFAEGLLSPGLIHKIPVVGPWSRAYSEWTFGEYIPKLKLKTFAAAMPRNLRWYRGKLSEDAIAARVGDAVNNAYGELNNLFLGKIGRNPATQRMLRGIFLAPDFGEARLRFVGKGLTSYGTEERLALATMFITLYTAARVGNWLSHGDPELDPKRAFQVKSGKHWWSMRSVIGDLDRAFLDTSRFFYVRLNPLYSRTAADWLFGRDINGRKLSPMEKIVKRPLNQLVPIQFQALTRDDQALWESLVGSIGLGAVSDTPQQDMYRLVDNWMKTSDDPKLQAAFKRREAEVFPPSDYTKLRYALRHDDEEGARKAYAELLKTRKPATITDAMLPGNPFTGSFPNELKFKKSLTEAQQRVYDQARQEQKEMYSKFQIIRRSPEPVEKEPTWEETVPVTE